MKVKIPDFLDASGIELIPQSMTTAPGLIHSPGTKLDLPIATTTISAVLTIEPKSFVLEWQTVTVQCLHFNSSDIGVPTILLLPKIFLESCVTGNELSSQYNLFTPKLLVTKAKR